MIFITSPQISEPPHMLEPVLKAFEFCHPSQSAAVPSSPDWHHEIKYDGYRLRLERDGDRVRLITSGPVDALGKVQEPKPPRDEQGQRGQPVAVLIFVQEGSQFSCLNPSVLCARGD